MPKSSYLQSLQQRSNHFIDQRLNQRYQSEDRLLSAMRYSVIEGGKRLRPVLTYATGELLNVDLARLDAPACALEFIHAYSLVHDDLPAMDDDDFRRGKPSCHKAFDEATAILVGDALQTLAFELLSEAQPGISPAQSLQMINTLARASGLMGMAGGQALDLQGSGKHLSLTEIEKLHQLKTGALFSASIQLAAIAADSISPPQNHALQNFSQAFGLAFQIQDDIHDVEGDITTLGKEPGSDARHDKSTYVAILGLEQAKLRLKEVKQKARASLDLWQEKALPLQSLIDELIPEPM